MAKGENDIMAYRLLIVPGNNETLRALPQEFSGDVTVQVVESANDALWEIRQTPPAVIIADVDLPGMSGIDLAELLPDFAVATKLILWSRETNQALAQQAASVGVAHMLMGEHSAQDVRALIGTIADSAAATVAPAPAATHVPAPAAPPAPERATPPPAPRAEPAPTPRADPASRTEPASDTRPTNRTAPLRPDRVPERAAEPPTRPAPRAAEAESPRATPPARRPLSRGRSGPIVLTGEMITPIRARIVELQQEVGAQCILLTDPNGMILVECGKTDGLPTMILLPMLSTSFSAAGQISQMLRENDSSALYMQEGTFYDLYCFDILRSFMLVLFFDKAASATKIGTVWVYAKRAIRDMHEHLI